MENGMRIGPANAWSFLWTKMTITRSISPAVVLRHKGVCVGDGAATQLQIARVGVAKKDGELKGSNSAVANRRACHSSNPQRACMVHGVLARLDAYQLHVASSGRAFAEGSRLDQESPA